MIRVLFTGGTGLVGSNVLPLLKKNMMFMRQLDKN